MRWSPYAFQTAVCAKGLAETEAYNAAKHVSGVNKNRMSLERLDEIEDNVRNGYRWRHDFEELIAEARLHIRG